MGRRVFAHRDAERLRWDCAHRCLAPSTRDGCQCPDPDLCPPMLAQPSGADVKAEGMWEQHREPVLHAFPSTSSGKLLQNNPRPWGSRLCFLPRKSVHPPPVSAWRLGPRSVRKRGCTPRLSSPQDHTGLHQALQGDGDSRLGQPYLPATCWAC